MITPKVRLVRPLRAGAMGSLWVAEHLTLHTEVAVKFLPIERLKDDPSLLTRFLREATLAARIKSPHVVATLDHGVSDDGLPYIVMELLEGETLNERLRRAGRLTPWQTAMVVWQVGKALANAHRLGIVHRDIKPTNLVLISSDDSGEISDPLLAEELFVKLVDFGIAKQEEPHDTSVDTSVDAMVGTPSFMSPEQLHGGPVDYRADLWALGVVTYLALTGELPFRAPSLAALCETIARGEFKPPSAMDDALPPEIDAWFARAFHPDPDQRFLGARQQGAEFMRLIRSAGVEPPSTLSGSIRDSGAGPSRLKSSALFVAALVTLAGIAAYVTAGWWGARHDGPSAASSPPALDTAADPAGQPPDVIPPADDGKSGVAPSSSVPAPPSASASAPPATRSASQIEPRKVQLR
jgi:serine/threonine-protein kinase